MKTPDTITAKVLEFDIRESLPFTLSFAKRNPDEIETIVADKINERVNEAIHEALLDVRRETAQEISARFKAMQERYPEFCLNLFYDENSDYVFIKTTEYERIKPT